MPNLLVEIGVEELPASVQDVVYSDMTKLTVKALATHRLSHKQILVEATPRRIALFIKDLGTSQKNQTLEISGPSHEKAYDNQGKPTKALQGFLKSKGATLKDVQVKELPKGKFVFIRKEEKGRQASALIPVLAEEIFSSLAFSKPMRWEQSGFRFPRPVRWVVALLDKKKIAVNIAGIKAGDVSYGHRFLSPKPFKIQSADWKLYQKTLKQKHVVLSLENRAKTIRQALEKRFNQKQVDEELVRITAQLVEEPFILQGGFLKTYLELPPEVLASCMKKNQKIFACYDAKGCLENKFVAVMNGKRNGLPRIRADFENVLESRLRDAQYFYDIDTKQPLESKRKLLEGVVYLGKLGTVLEKTERMEKLADTFARLIGRDDLRHDLVRAARLSKIDLISQLVYEFPDLQGIAGREYALEAGEAGEVAQALGTQYSPKSLNENYEDIKKYMTPFGAMLGIVDRLDLIVGAFGIGLEPTGSQDPFALRRAGGSIVKLIRTFSFHFFLAEIIDESIKLYGNKLKFNSDEIQSKLIGSFLKERTARELNLQSGTRSIEIFQAVWKSSCSQGCDVDISDVYDRFRILDNLHERDVERFMQTAKVVERTSNILKGVKEDIPSSVNPALFKEPIENQLYQLLEDRSDEISDILQKRDYEKATLLFGKIFYAPVHDFFKQVMVNVEDREIRGNRQALMKRIHGLYADRLADLSMLSRIDIE